MRPTLAVIAPHEFALDQLSSNYGVEAVPAWNLENESLPNDVAGLLIYNAGAAPLDWSVAELVDDAIAAGTLVLASASGMHILNVALGGDGAKEVPGHVSLAEGPVKRTSVFLAPGAKVSSTIGGSGWLGLPCDHQKGISQAGLAPGLMTSAISDDRIVEAFEMPGHRWVIGVQWDVFGANRLPRGFDAIWMAFIERVTSA